MFGNLIGDNLNSKAVFEANYGSQILILKT